MLRRRAVLWHFWQCGRLAVHWVLIFAMGVAVTHCCNGNDGGSLSWRGASGSGTFDWLVVRCGGERTRTVVTGGSGGSTR